MNKLPSIVLPLLLLMSAAWAQQRAKPRKPIPVESQAPYAQEETQDEREDNSADKTDQREPYERAGRRKKAERTMIVTDLKGREVELTDFHLGSGGLWEYDGLRVKKLEPAPHKPQGRAAKARTMRKQIDQRIRNKNNKEAQLPRVELNKDTLVKWDDIKEAHITKNRDEQNATVTYTAKINTTKNALIEGRIKSPSDYVIGTTVENKEVYFRLKDIKKISFISPEAKSQAKTSKPTGTKTDRPRTKVYKSENSNTANRGEKAKSKHPY